MRIIVKVWSSDSERGLGYDYAIIECSEALLKRSLHRIGILRSQRALDPSLDEMCYWDSSAEYFSLWVHPPSPEAENQSCELAKTIDALEVDNREAVIVAEQLNVPQRMHGNRGMCRNDRTQRRNHVQRTTETRRCTSDDG